MKAPGSYSVIQCTFEAVDLNIVRFGARTDSKTTDWFGDRTQAVLIASPEAVGVAM